MILIILHIYVFEFWEAELGMLWRWIGPGAESRDDVSA
jgi:hypothetical protein